jgi:hypothetical protein
MARNLLTRTMLGLTILVLAATTGAEERDEPRRLWQEDDVVGVENAFLTSEDLARWIERTERANPDHAAHMSDLFTARIKAGQACLVLWTYTKPAMRRLLRTGDLAIRFEDGTESADVGMILLQVPGQPLRPQDSAAGPVVLQGSDDDVGAGRCLYVFLPRECAGHVVASVTAR